MASAKVKSRFWDVMHNCIAHPLLVLLPEKLGDRLHDWTAEKAYE